MYLPEVLDLPGFMVSRSLPALAQGSLPFSVVVFWGALQCSLPFPFAASHLCFGGFIPRYRPCHNPECTNQISHKDLTLSSVKMSLSN